MGNLGRLGTSHTMGNLGRHGTTSRRGSRECFRGTVTNAGWSLADCVMQTDEGSAGGPAMPAGAAALAKAQAARRKRFKESYSIIYKHELDEDHRSHIAQNHFQDGPGATSGSWCLRVA